VYGGGWPGKALWQDGDLLRLAQVKIGLGVQQQGPHPRHRAGVQRAVDVGVKLARAAGLPFNGGGQPGGVHVQGHHIPAARVEALGHAEQLGLVLGAVDEPFQGQAGGAVLRSALGLLPVALGYQVADDWHGSPNLPELSPFAHTLHQPQYRFLS